MSLDLDSFPFYDPLIDNTKKMSGTWVNSMTTFIQTLTDYLSQNGIFLPQLTQDQITGPINGIKNPVEGQLLYNSTTKRGQIYENGAWVNLT